MARFVLVHGAGDGALIWDKLIPEVEARGHRAAAMDLPCDDIDASIEDDTDVIESAIPRRRR